jgi:hypothetical protein
MVRKNQCQVVHRAMLAATSGGGGTIRLREGDYISPPIVLGPRAQLVNVPPDQFCRDFKGREVDGLTNGWAAGGVLNGQSDRGGLWSCPKRVHETVQRHRPHSGGISWHEPDTDEWPPCVGRGIGISATPSHELVPRIATSFVPTGIVGSCSIMPRLKSLRCRRIISVRTSAARSVRPTNQSCHVGICSTGGFSWPRLSVGFRQARALL